MNGWMNEWMNEWVVGGTDDFFSNNRIEHLDVHVPTLQFTVYIKKRGSENYLQVTDWLTIPTVGMYVGIMDAVYTVYTVVLCLYLPTYLGPKRFSLVKTKN